jgi:putative PEP-CTERM system histidine kinase
MPIYLFYAANLLLLLSSLLVFRLKSAERRFSLALIQALLCLPILAAEYIYLAYHLEPRVVPLLLVSETVFALLWFGMAYRLRRLTVTPAQQSRLSFLIHFFIGTVMAALIGYCLITPPAIRTRIADHSLVFNLNGSVYFYAIILLISVLAMAWHLEKFWRTLEPARRWEYKFLVVGGYLICGTMAWAASYRLTFLRLVPDHFLLAAVLVLVGWSFMCYATTHHRLLNRKMFVSRKIVYAFVAPSILAVYLLALGIISLIMRSFGLPLPFVLRWLFLALGLVAIGLFAVSGKLRRRIQFFISTHFYVNKYEYRDEWLALSRQLQGALTEADVIKALRQVLSESLYTTNLIIWLGDPSHGYRIVSPNGNPDGNANALAPDDPLVGFLQQHPYFDVNEKEADGTWKAVAQRKEGFLTDLNLVLTAPLFIGEQLVGLIGLGPEFTGGRYGHDDFDLLTALGTQAASALLAVRMSEKLAHSRERRAWDRLSAFVLHDVKNAATMLALASENAADHIQNPAFQQDMLAAVNDALARMTKVQERLNLLKGEVAPLWQDMELRQFLEDHCAQLGKKLGAVDIALDCRTSIRVNSDPQLLLRILENLLLNALEAGGDGRVLRITAARDDDQGQAVIEFTDNGPGIAADLLPDALFEPFKTTKPKGTGIGLWQVRRLVTSLKGTISAENVERGGARFVVRLPLVGVEKSGGD